MATWDVVVIGGGMAGLAAAYYLARSGARTLLLQAGDLGGGTSAACTGRAQVNEGHLDPLNLRLVTDGLKRLETLEDELDCGFEYRRLGMLCLIDRQEQWAEWAARAAALNGAGIPTELLDTQTVQYMEPYLALAGYLGAAYSVEGHVNPLRFCWAYAAAAQRCGAVLHPQTPVTGLRLQAKRIVGVETAGEYFAAGQVAIMAGAWTPLLTRLAGVDLPIRHTHAEAFITEPVPAYVRNTIALSGFYESIHGLPRAISAGVTPLANGTLFVSEAVTKTTEIHRRTSAWGLAGMAADLLKLYPVLSGVHAVRSWGIPTPYTPDDEPVFGWVPDRDNLFVAAGFLLTITALPLLGEWAARLLLGQGLDVSLDLFAPDRFKEGAYAYHPG